MNDFSVAVLQPKIVDGEVEANLAHYTELLSAITEPTDLILLPEMFPSGYHIRAQYIESHLGRSVEWMQSIAARFNTLVGGTIAVTDAEKNYNRFYLVAPEGVLSYYDKQHLFVLAREEKLFTAGDHRVVVSFLGWRIALQTCFDLRFPEGARNKGDYDLLLYAASWPAARDYAWRQLLVARAIENQTYVAAANRVGTDAKGNNYVGHSYIIDSEGKICAELPDEAEGVLCTTLNKGQQERLRTDYPFLLHD